MKFEIHHAYTCWELYTFTACKPQDFCVFIELVISLSYTGHFWWRNDQYKDIRKPIPTAGDTSNSKILPLSAPQVSPVDTHKQDKWVWQAIWWTQYLTTSHFLEINLPHTEQPYTGQTIIHGQGTSRHYWSAWPSEVYILNLIWSHSVVWQILGQNKLMAHLFLLHTFGQSTYCNITLCSIEATWRINLSVVGFN